MDELPRQKLAELIAQYGTKLCQDPKRCENLLRDLCASNPREVSILTSALRERVAQELLATSSLPLEALLPKLVQRLQDNLGLAPEAARWGVATWAVVLGVDPSCLNTASSSCLQGASEKPVRRPFRPQAAPVDSNPRSLLVSKTKPGAYSTVTAALAAAQDRDEIVIERGDYEEELRIEKRVTLRGIGSRALVILRCTSFHCLLIGADVTIRNLTVIGRPDRRFPETSFAALHHYAGELLVENASLSATEHRGRQARFTLRDCRIQGSGACGVHVDRHSTGVLEGCEVGGGAGEGVFIYESESVVLRSCSIQENGRTGVASYGSHVVVERSTIEHNRGAGIESNGDSKVTIHDSIMRGNDGAGLVVDGATAKVLDSQSTGNSGAGACIHSWGNAQIERCRITHNGCEGVAVLSGGNGDVRDCDLRSNKWGAWLVERGCRLDRSRNKEELLAGLRGRWRELKGRLQRAG